MIVSDVLQAVSERRSSLVLTEQKTHVDLLEKELRAKVPRVIALTGGQPAKERQRLMEQIIAVPKEEPLVIVATGKYVGEGFDARAAGYAFSGYANLMAGYACAICRASSSSA